MKFHARMLKVVVLIAFLALPMVQAQTNKDSGPDKGSQVKEEQKFFHLDFVVKELEGNKVINHRTYSMEVATFDNDNDGMNQNHRDRSVRTGTKVPVDTGDGKMQYLDVGVNFDCRNIQQVNQKLALTIVAEVSSVQDATNAGQHGTPFILQNKWDSQVIVPFGKPTIIFSSDEATSNRTIEVELTVTPMQP